ncbi:MAG: hypothetical protein M1823_000516 [Watsoniomyces obsoletus]|nr:MAG: hypothetical protein M1823_000516 [Watsoniomyces obsoletus]
MDQSSGHPNRSGPQPRHSGYYGGPRGNRSNGRQGDSGYQQSHHPINPAPSFTGDDFPPLGAQTASTSNVFSTGQQLAPEATWGPAPRAEGQRGPRNVRGQGRQGQYQNPSRPQGNSYHSRSGPSGRGQQSHSRGSYAVSEQFAGGYANTPYGQARSTTHQVVHAPGPTTFHTHVQGPGPVAPLAVNPYQPPLGFNHHQQPHSGHHPSFQQLVPIQSARLEYVALSVVAESGIGEEEVREKDQFRAAVESVSQEVIAKLEHRQGLAEEKKPADVKLVAFGSLQSGFALKSSDMDLMLLAPHSDPPVSAPESPVPRALEKGFLEKGWGARLLTKTRVPIIQLCEKPTAELLTALKQRVDREEPKTGVTMPSAENTLDDEMTDLAQEGPSSGNEHDDKESECTTEIIPIKREHDESVVDSDDEGSEKNSGEDEPTVIITRATEAPLAVKEQQDESAEDTAVEDIPRNEEHPIEGEHSSEKVSEPAMDLSSTPERDSVPEECSVETPDEPAAGGTPTIGGNSVMDFSVGKADQDSRFITKDSDMPATEESAETTTHLSKEQALAGEESDETTEALTGDVSALDIHSSAVREAAEGFTPTDNQARDETVHHAEHQTEVVREAFVGVSPAKGEISATTERSGEAATGRPITIAHTPLTGTDEEPSTNNNTSTESDAPQNTGSASLTRDQKKKAARNRKSAARKAAKRRERESTGGFENDLMRLHQLDNDDLFAYMQKAKKLAGKLEEERPSTSETGADLDRGARLVNAFIAGIADETFRQRLMDRISARAAQPVQSLSDLWVYIEGEQCVMAWEGRELDEQTRGKQAEAEHLIQNWRDLHKGVQASGAELSEAAFTMWKRIRSLPSVKLATLYQKSNETGSSYHSRSFHILTSLGGHDLSMDGTHPLRAHEKILLNTVIHQYIRGLRGEEIRQQLRQYVQSVEQHVSFGQLFHQQEAELLISRAKKAIKGDREGLEKRQIIDDYVDLVRQYGAAPNGPIFEARERLRQMIGTTPTPTDQHHPGHHNRHDALEIPKSGVGIQCDINFSNHLAIHNTQLLRCYDQCDARVKPMVLAVKAWAKAREINSAYHGTLSSYGYVLMVLHFLVNVASPPVAPNLQQTRSPSMDPRSLENSWVDNYHVHFWCDEDEIGHFARQGWLSNNQQSLGELLRQFFEYYTHQGHHVMGGGFCWAMDVLSIRTVGGVLSKKTKGWTGARTTVVEATEPGQKQKEVRHRYLFAIEDPFEIEHNVARTVTHNGIVAIRDEFRRAWNIISNYGKKSEHEDISEVFKAVSIMEPRFDKGGNGKGRETAATPGDDRIIW